MGDVWVISGPRAGAAPSWQFRAGLLWLGILLSPSALAGDSDWSALGQVALGGMAGGVVGLGLWVWLLIRGASRGGWQQAGRVAAGLLLVPLGAVLGAAIVAEVASAAKKMRNTAHARQEQQFRTSPLKLATCGADGEWHATKPQTGSQVDHGLALGADAAPNDPKLRALAEAEPLEMLVRVLDTCTVGLARRDPLPALFRFEVMAPVLAQRLSGLTGPDTPQPWCDLVSHIHMDASVEHLRILHRLKLPMACRKKGQESWSRAAQPGRIKLSAEDEARSLAFYRFVLQTGVALGQPHGAEGTNLLHWVVDCREPRLVLLALQAGSDPGLADPVARITPRLRWLQRRYESAGLCALRNWPDEANEQAVQQVTQLMGPPGAQELNTGSPDTGTTLLWETRRDGAGPQNHALLRELLSLGARLDHRDAKGDTFLQQGPVLDPASLALLAQQPAEVLQALGQAQPVPLVQAARKRGDEGLARLLCQHGAAGC